MLDWIVRTFFLSPADLVEINADDGGDDDDDYDDDDDGDDDR